MRPVVLGTDYVQRRGLCHALAMLRMPSNGSDVGNVPFGAPWLFQQWMWEQRVGISTPALSLSAFTGAWLLVRSNSRTCDDDAGNTKVPTPGLSRSTIAMS